MALTVVSGYDKASFPVTRFYHYLYEPLDVEITETDSGVTKCYIDLILINAETGTTVSTISEYGLFDLLPNITLRVDIMKLIRQYDNADVYKIRAATAVTYQTVITEYAYDVKIRTDVPNETTIKTLPLRGVRSFDLISANPLITGTPSITERDIYGITFDAATAKWSYRDIPVMTLQAPTATDVRPTLAVTDYIATNNSDEPCGGTVIWKSRLGGWMYWGFDIRTESHTGRYEGNIEVGMYETDENGIFTPSDYTKVKTSYTYSLKSLSLSSIELEAFKDIASAPVVYYKHYGSKFWEMMRLASPNVPVSTLSDGGDVSITLRNILKAEQFIR